MDRMKEGVQKRVRRLQQSVSQNVGLVEKKDELSKVVHIEQRIQRMLTAIKNTRQGVSACLRTGGGRDESERRKRKLEEYQLHLQLLNDSKELIAVDGSNLLASVMRTYGDAIGVMVDELVKAESNMEPVLDAFGKYHEDEKTLTKAKDKLNRTALDVESARRRLQGAHDESRFSEIQEEFDTTHLKLDNCKDGVITDMYTLCSKEMDMAQLFSTLIEIQTEYHRTAVRTLENLLPDISRKIATYNRRPVFGCPLEDHLRYTGEPIAEVLKVCCTALCNQGLSEKGLFRVSGNNNRIRRLKAAFDAHEQVVEEYETDPHSICSVLKSYLRELPEPLMTHALYSKWINATRLEGDDRKQAVQNILTEMPPAYLHNLAYLMKFLQLVLSYEQENKMNAGNLSIVFGPNLIGGGGAIVNESDNMIGSRLVETLLLNADTFFPEDRFPYSAQLSAGLTQRLLDETGGFEMERSPPRSTAYHHQYSDSFTGSLSSSPRPLPPAEQVSPSSSGSLRRLAKPPAPPPPPPQSRIQDLSSSNEQLETSSDLIHVSKSPSIASNDSGEYWNNSQGEDLLPSMDQRPSRPPPPRALNVTASPRPTSYMMAVVDNSSSSTSDPFIVAGNERPPTAPRRTTIASQTIDNRTVLVVDPSADAPSPTKPPLPIKPKQDEMTKL